MPPRKYSTRTSNPPATPYYNVGEALRGLAYYMTQPHLEEVQLLFDSHEQGLASKQGLQAQYEVELAKLEVQRERADATLTAQCEYALQRLQQAEVFYKLHPDYIYDMRVREINAKLTANYAVKKGAPHYRELLAVENAALTKELLGLNAERQAPPQAYHQLVAPQQVFLCNPENQEYDEDMSIGMEVLTLGKKLWRGGSSAVEFIYIIYSKTIFRTRLSSYSYWIANHRAIY